MATIPKPGFSIAEATELLTSHDGDDRSGMLSEALADLVKAREYAETPKGFLESFDQVLARLIHEQR